MKSNVIYLSWKLLTWGDLHGGAGPQMCSVGTVQCWLSFCLAAVMMQCVLGNADVSQGQAGHFPVSTLQRMTTSEKAANLQLVTAEGLGNKGRLLRRLWRTAREAVGQVDNGNCIKA